MPLRLIEVRASTTGSGSVRELLAAAPVIDHWTMAADEGTEVHRALLPSESVETLTDALSTRLAGDDALRIVLLAVEATLPKVEEPETAPATPGNAADPGAERSKGSDRVSREELHQDMEAASALTPVYLVTVVLSTVVAAVGLLRGDVAVIIGAMVIAPLLGPNVALSLAATLGDVDLARHALRSNLAGAALALALSFALGLLVGVDPTIPELAARTQVGLSDIALALAAGSAGALAFTTGLPTAVIGVMVAVALLPPLVATGLLAGGGFTREALAAATLVATNITCVNLAGVATFLLRRVGPREWWEADRAKTTTRIAIATWVSLLAVLVLLILFAWNDKG